MRINKAIPLALVLLVLLGGAALAAASASYRLPSAVLSSAGGEATSASYRVVNTAGQPAAGDTTSASYRLQAGFLGALAAAAAPELPVTFPDANLEAVIRVAIAKPSGDIYPADLLPLTTLDASGRDISNLSGLEYCINLTNLHLNNNQIADISPLQNLTGLVYLELAYNQIVNISPLQGLTSLTYLYLNHNQIVNISPLQGLTSLTYLYLYNNQISDISPLQNRTSLTQLFLGGNQIVDVSPLQGLTRLRTLSLYANQIVNISPLKYLTGLVHLELADNQIVDVFPLQGLTSLGSLGLYANRIVDISPLQNLTGLMTLSLGANQVSNISSLRYLINLKNLGLQENQISDIQPLFDNAGLASGDTVYLMDNPLSFYSITVLIPLLEDRKVTVAYTPPVDSDGDGISDIVDVEPGSRSENFSDGNTSGGIISLDPEITIWITDAPDPADGIEVVVSGPESGSATIRVDVAGGSTLWLPPGDYVLTTFDADGLRVDVRSIAAGTKAVLHRPDSRGYLAMLRVGVYETRPGSLIVATSGGGLAEVEYTIGGASFVVIMESDETVNLDEHLVDGELQKVIITAVQGEVTVNGVIVPEGGSLSIQPPLADANGPYESNEGSPITFDGSGSNDPDGTIVSVSWDFGDGNVVSDTDLSPSHTYQENGVYTVTLTVTDNDGLVDTDTTTVTVLNVAPAVGNIIAPLDPLPLGTNATANASFNDPGVLDTHTAIWDWGDGITSDGIINETGGSGTVAGNHTYAEAGVYTITLTVSDDDGGEGQSMFRFLVVYDPEGGFVTGGGWINSPAGAYAADPTLTGKATFGFVSKYQKGATTPTGNTEFQFKTGNLNFHSNSYDWLVIAGHKAMYKGVGTINGVGNYGFMLSAVDEKLTPSTDIDMFRIKIWDKDNGDAIVYDNQMGDTDDAEPATAIEGGSIVIHSK